MDEDVKRWTVRRKGVAAAGLALRVEEDAAGGRGCVASGREAGAGGGVVKAAVPCDAENEDLRAVQKAKASPKLSLRGSPASERGTVETQRLDHRRKAA